MEATEATREFQQKIMRDYGRASAMDIYLGILLLWGGGALTILGDSWYAVAAFGLPLIALFLLFNSWKRRVIYPRLGYVKAKPTLKVWVPRQALTFLIWIPLNLGLMLLLDRLRPRIGLHGVTPLGQAGLTPIASIYAAVSFISPQYKTDKVYAVIFLIVVIGTAYLDLSAILPYMLLGLLFLMVGIFRLRRFLREHPVIEGEPDGSH
jgi:hypothetical protein